MKNILFLILCIILIFSCKRESKKDFFAGKVKEISFIINKKSPDDFIKSCDFLMLEDTCRESLFAEISKLKIKGNRIYILDFSGSKTLHVFNNAGKFLHNIGKTGSGPGEYKKIFDFDVVDSKVYIYDGTNRNILIYHKDGAYLGKKKIPFPINSFSLLDNGRFIMSLPKVLNQPKVVITDSLFKVDKEYFKYSEKDMGDKFDIGIFQEFSEGFVYNKPINDTIFIFSKTGDIKKAYYIDFQKKRVPDELRKSYQEFLNERELHDYNYFYSTPVFIRNHIIGNIFSGNTKAFVNIDTKRDQCYMKLLKENTINMTDPYLPLTVMNDSIIVSYLNDGIYNVINKNHSLDERMIKQLEEGGTVLCFYHLR